MFALDTYTKAADRIRKLEAAVQELATSDDPALAEVIGPLQIALERTCNALAQALGRFAHDATALLTTHSRTAKKYHIDNIFEALGRYQYPGGNDSDAAPLLSLRYDVETLVEALTPPAAPEPADPDEAVATCRHGVDVESDCAECDAKAEPAISEYAREQEPDPGLIRN